MRIVFTLLVFLLIVEDKVTSYWYLYVDDNLFQISLIQ